VSSKSPARRRYNRVLVKVSGECFGNPETLASLTGQFAALGRQGVKLAVVVGGGNILRGRDTKDMDRATADRAGMLATTINGIRLAQALKDAAHLCAFGIPGFVERYSVERGLEELAKGRVLVLSGGTGNPFFSTDSAAALRAAELSLDAILKATNVRGVYSADPRKDPRAKFYPELTYARALEEKLAVMDLTAFALCMERRIPIHVFDVTEDEAIIGIVKGKPIGSRVC